MKRLLYIPFIFMLGCSSDIELLDVIATNNIFNVTQSNVANNQSIHFDLPSIGTYTLTLIDKESGQVISREKFIGQRGENVKKIYTKSLQSRYLYLLLEDVTKKELGKTTIIIK